MSAQVVMSFVPEAKESWSNISVAMNDSYSIFSSLGQGRNILEEPGFGFGFLDVTSLRPKET